MTRMVVSLLVLAFGVAGLAMTVRAQQEPTTEIAQQQENPPPPEPPVTACKPDRILVKVQPGVDAAAVVARYGGTIIRTIPDIDVNVVTLPAGQGLSAIDALNADPEVKYAEADAIVKATQKGAGC